MGWLSPSMQQESSEHTIGMYMILLQIHDCEAVLFDIETVI